MFTQSISHTCLRVLFASVSFGVLAFGALGCSDSAEEDAQGEILPHLSPVPLGDFYPLGDAEEDVATRERTPYEWVLLLQAKGGNVKIEQACIVGDDQFFLLEGPKPEESSPRTPSAIRVTYDRQKPSNKIDQAAIVIQSNTTNFPTLVVPICARVIENGKAKTAFDCVAPVEVAAGTKDGSLCDK